MHQIFYMKKSRKYIKLLLSLFLVVIILGINSFASVVSDNDGSAFVTNKTTAKMIQHKKVLKILSFLYQILSIIV